MLCHFTAENKWYHWILVDDRHGKSCLLSIFFHHSVIIAKFDILILWLVLRNLVNLLTILNYVKCYHSRCGLWACSLVSLQVLENGNVTCYIRRITLTHWGRVSHIYVGKLTVIGSDNGLSPGRRQAIIWNNAGILLIGPLGTNVSEILIEIYTFSFKKMHLKMSSGKITAILSRRQCVDTQQASNMNVVFNGWLRFWWVPKTVLEKRRNGKNWLFDPHPRLSISQPSLLRVRLMIWPFKLLRYYLSGR